MRILSTLVLRPNRIEESERIWNREIKKSKTTSAEFRQKLRTVTNAAKKSKTTSAEFRGGCFRFFRCVCDGAEFLAEFRGGCFRFFDFPVPNSLGFFDSIWT